MHHQVAAEPYHEEIKKHVEKMTGVKIDDFLYFTIQENFKLILSIHLVDEPNIDAEFFFPNLNIDRG